MRHTIRMLLTSALAAMMTLQAFGETSADTVKVLFRMGYSQFDPSLGDNRAAMDRFIDQIDAARKCHRLDSIVVRGNTSPDGISTANQRLSLKRCETVARVIEQRAEIPSHMIRTYADGVAWNELRDAVADNPEVPFRDEILDILDYVPLWVYGNNGKIVDGKKKRLMDLDGGRAYRWLQTNIFPQLRNAIAVSLYVSPAAQEQASIPEESKSSETSAIPGDSVRSGYPELYELSESSEIPETLETSTLEEIPVFNGQPKPFYMTVKTNMLYDAALVPNIGAEFHLGKNISIYGEWMYGWWDSNPRHRYWRIYGGDAGLRWWFGRKAHEKPLTGHHIGVYGGILTFDFELGGTGYMGGKPGGTLWDRRLFNAGIEYGYSLPVAKRLNIDFSIGLGYLGGNYIKYYPFDNDYYFDKEYKLHFFGPTKAEISLIWLLGRGNTNRKGAEE